MKKLLTVLLTLILTLLLSFALIACDSGDKDNGKDGTKSDVDNPQNIYTTEQSSNSTSGNGNDRPTPTPETCEHISVGDNGICPDCSKIIFTEGLKFILNENATGYILLNYSGNETNVFVPDYYKGVPITEIWEEAFYGCKEIEKVVLPESITKIGREAFAYCENLKSTNIPKSTKIIEKSSFIGCCKLENIVLPEGLTNIAFGWDSSISYNIYTYMVKGKNKEL